MPAAETASYTFVVSLLQWFFQIPQADVNMGNGQRCQHKRKAEFREGDEADRAGVAVADLRNHHIGRYNGAEPKDRERDQRQYGEWTLSFHRDSSNQSGLTANQFGVHLAAGKALIKHADQLPGFSAFNHRQCFDLRILHFLQRFS